MKVKSPHWCGRIKSIDRKPDRVAVTVETDHAGAFVLSVPLSEGHKVQVDDECDLKMILDEDYLDDKERKQLEEQGFLLDAPFTRTKYDSMSIDMATDHGILYGLKVEWWSLKEIMYTMKRMKWREKKEIMYKLGEIYKNAHDLVVKTSNPKAIEILKLCNQMAEEYNLVLVHISTLGEEDEERT